MSINIADAQLCHPLPLLLLLLLPLLPLLLRLAPCWILVCLDGQLLGLLLPKYVPDASLLSQPSWEGVVSNADALVPMLQQHIIEPLLEGALCHTVPAAVNVGFGRPGAVGVGRCASGAGLSQRVSVCLGKDGACQHHGLHTMMSSGCSCFLPDD